MILPKHLNNYVNFNGFNLNERQISALEKMGTDYVEFSYKSYAELFDTSLTTSKRDLNDLLQKNLVYQKKTKRTQVFYIA